MLDRSNEIENFIDKVKKSQHVLIVGGRGVGVEIAAEIAEHFPNKKITLVHSRKNLMDIWPSGAIELLNSFMQKNNVNVVSFIFIYFSFVLFLFYELIIL